MATIYKRLTEDGKVRYTAYIRLKGHPRQSQTFDRKADAVRWAKQHETAVQTGRYLISQEASKRTPADLIDRYMEHVLSELLVFTQAGGHSQGSNCLSWSLAYPF